MSEKCGCWGRGFGRPSSRRTPKRRPGMNEIAINLDGTGLSIGIVRGRFNESIGLAMLEACRTRLAGLGVSPSQVEAISVPGALEVPPVLQKLAATGHYDALIALGA